MRSYTTFEGELLSLLDEPLKHAGYYVVQLKLVDGKRKKTLQLIVERLDATPMSVEDCETISSTASALLDVHDPIETAYDLEVSSPGMERPLISIEDFEAYMGSEVAIELNIAQDGQKRFKGKIVKVEDEKIEITQENKKVILSFSQMKSAHLIATDEMIRQLLRA